MIIAVNTRFLDAGSTEGSGNYIFECLSRLTEKYPQHQFLYLFDKPYSEDLAFKKNVIPVVTGPVTKNTLLWQYWFNYKIPAVLHKYKANVFISMDGICSLRTQVPQFLLVQDLSFIPFPQFFKKAQARFFRKFTPGFLAKAKCIATVSQFSRSVITDRYNIPSDKINVIYGGVDEIFKPVRLEEKEIIKEKYSDSKEYFLCPGSTKHQYNLVGLLKAFSFFKKRQKSNMILIIAGKPDEQFNTDLKTFKYRNEVRVLENPEKKVLAKITAAAYAIVYPVLYDDFARYPLQAMQCEVPVITSNTGALPELCGDAALYFDPGDVKDFAEKMMLVFKDEHIAKELVKAGKIQVQLYQWDKTADLLWRSVLKAINN